MAETTDQNKNPLPLFYTAPEPVNPDRHQNKGLVQTGEFGFAAKAVVIPLMAAEMPAAMRSYPIVFSGPEFMPMVVVGIKEGENLFVGEDGKWADPHYVPAYTRRYPFVLAGSDTDERLTLCVDADPARLVDLDDPSAKNAKPMFEDGEQGAVVNSALAFCQEYQGMLVKTKAIMKVIAEAGLLAERNSKITLGDGKNFNITGFHLIDEAKLLAMDDDAFLGLRKADALATIYCHLASMNSWTSVLHQANLRA